MLVLSLTLFHPRDYSLPGFSVHGIIPARILEGDAISSSRGSSLPSDQIHVSCIPCIGSKFFTTEHLGTPCCVYNIVQEPRKVPSI